MNTFLDWLNKRRINEDINNFEDPVNNFKFNQSDVDYAEDQDKVELELLKTVLRKYPEETLDFLTTIAQRGDNEVGALLRKIDKSGPKLGQKPEHPSEKEQVVPSVADSGYGNEDRL